ncbi:hypothetical protein [Xenorhabdus eapokensis]|uniref:Uncharacterized protein n=1 Tax=Xenorhabdus eapokensis TaxID=1873482 RepID=A0A1Q5TK89_9GAMM|nr:hypothetical protein [Xenorhabdus eapokensis]OKP00634.1 hypothetical protein Xedl_03223 [Xenorhabdus eapokensis]
MGMIIYPKDGKFRENDVKALIGSELDDQHWQLRVSMSGGAYLSSEWKAVGLESVLFRFETFCMGNDYVGPNAANDLHFVQRITNALNENWSKKNRGYIDTF